MQRVLVMGCSGSGKSTLGQALARQIGVPYVSLDALYWQPGWKPSDDATFDPKVAAEAAKPTWVIDGNYVRHAGELRRARADTVIWFDLPRWICLFRVLSRIARTYGTVRSDMAAGCPEQFDLEFLHYIWTFRTRQRPRLLSYFAGLREDQRLITIRQNCDVSAVLTQAEVR